MKFFLCKDKVVRPLTYALIMYACLYICLNTLGMGLFVSCMLSSTVAYSGSLLARACCSGGRDGVDRSPTSARTRAPRGTEAEE